MISKIGNFTVTVILHFISLFLINNIVIIIRNNETLPVYWDYIIHSFIYQINRKISSSFYHSNTRISDENVYLIHDIQHLERLN